MANKEFNKEIELDFLLGHITSSIFDTDMAFLFQIKLIENH